MNEKTCKALRRIARESGLAAATGWLINTKTGVIVVDPRCERAIYRHMKKQLKREGTL